MNFDANVYFCFALVISELQKTLFTLREALAESRGKTSLAQLQGVGCVHGVLGRLGWIPWNDDVTFCVLVAFAGVHNMFKETPKYNIAM